MSKPLAQIYEEHRSIAAVLSTLSRLVREVRDRGASIDPKAFRAILYYLDVFGEREHHPKEDKVLFPLLRERTHEADEVLDDLHLEHEAGEQAIRNLEQAFIRYEERGEIEFPAFAAAADVYVTRYFEHMRKEEHQVMPVAERVLTAEDWTDVEAAFAAHCDPLSGISQETGIDQLYQRILAVVPSPYGLGEPIDA
jgi:hemerythrin-like domain-containing protein